MLLKDLLENCPEKYADTEIKYLTANSGKVKKDCAFICVKGAKFDGHNFAKEALEKGAAVVITERDLGLEKQIVVKDTRIALALCSAKWFKNPADNMKIIGVTGTNGKTSVTYMLKSVIESKGYKVGLIGTIQNMIGDKVVETNNTTPGAYELQELFYEMYNSGCEYVVMEVSSHALDQKRVYGFTFDVAVFTNLTQDHLDYHLTMDNYFEAKKKLFKMCRTAVINADDSYAERISEGLNCKIITVSAESNETTYSAKNINYRADGVEYELVGYGLINRMRLKTGGKFTVYNSMCVSAAAMELGFQLPDISKALADLNGVKGRAEVVPCDLGFTVIIDYAHTPDGLENILNTFRKCKNNKLTVLFGCGGDRDRTKRQIMGKIAVSLADNVIVTSDNPRTENPELIIEDILVGMKDTKTPYTVIENRVEAIKYAVNTAEQGDIIVLAGKGHETYQILSTGTIHMDEREIVADVIAEFKGE